MKTMENDEKQWKNNEQIIKPMKAVKYDKLNESSEEHWKKRITLKTQ